MTLEGIVRTPEQEDDYYKNRGPIPPFRNEYGCIQDVVGYTTDDSVLGNSLRYYKYEIANEVIAYEQHIRSMQKSITSTFRSVTEISLSVCRI